MHFLNAALFPSLLLLTALPLLVHWLNQRFPKLFEFSSVREIRQSIAQRSSFFRLRHLILMILRTVFLAALLLAFLRPVLARFGGEGVPGHLGRTVLLCIDHSLSMEYRGGGLSARQRTLSEVDKLLSTLAPSDSLNVILVGASPVTAFVGFSHSHAEARRFVENAGAGLGTADFTRANALAARLLSKAAPNAELYYFSDFQRQTWAGVDFSALPAESRFFFVETGDKTPRENRAILSVTLDSARVLAGESVTLEIEVGNFRETPMNEPVKVVVDGRLSFEKEVSVAAWSVGRISLPVPPGGPGLHQCEVSIAPDDLPQDDRFFLTVPVLEKEAILIVSDATGDAARYLKTALNPYENLAGSLLPEVVRADQLDAARLAAARKVFFTRAGLLNEAACKALAGFLFQGGGAVYFADGEHDAENLAGLERALAGTALPLKLGGKRVAKNVSTGAQQIARGDFKSRFLRLFRGAARQNLALLEFYDIHDASATGEGQVLLQFADETPAMASLNHGLGTLLLMNFSLSEFSSNLVRQRVFPAWIQEIVRNLASDEAAASSTRVGELVEDELWKTEVEAVPLKKPSGQPLVPRIEAMGQRTAITFVPEELGFYSMRGARLLRAYGINPPAEESDLRPIDRALLPAQLGDKGRQGFFVGGHTDFEDLARGRPLFHWFVFAALGLLAVELGFQSFLKGAR